VRRPSRDDPPFAPDPDALPDGHIRRRYPDGRAVVLAIPRDKDWIAVLEHCFKADGMSIDAASVKRFDAMIAERKQREREAQLPKKPPR
jgi:hypothetical protein